MNFNKTTYNQLFQTNSFDFFSTLTNVNVLHDNGQVFLYSTDETIHVKCRINGEEVILVCFTEQDVNTENRYQTLEELNKNYQLDFLPIVAHKKNEISFNGNYTSLVLVDNKQLISLEEYVNNISLFPELISKLQNDLKGLFSEMKSKQIAHGNISLKTINVNEKNNLVLSFLDDLYLPEFETTNIAKYSFTNLHNKDTVAFGLMLSALEITKTDSTIHSDNLIFNYNSENFDDFQNSIAYTLIKSYENEIANKYLEFELLSETEQHSDYEDESISIENQTNEIIDKTQKIIITSSPAGVTVRDDEFEALGSTPFTIEVKERDHPYELILTDKNKIKKVDVYYGIEDVFIDFDEQYASGDIPSNDEVFQESKSSTQRNVFWWYVVLLFVAMIIVIIYNENVRFYSDAPVEEAPAIDSIAATIDSMATITDSVASPYYYEDSSNEYYEEPVTDSSAYYYDGY